MNVMKTGAGNEFRTFLVGVSVLTLMHVLWSLISVESRG